MIESIQPKPNIHKNDEVGNHSLDTSSPDSPEMKNRAGENKMQPSKIVIGILTTSKIGDAKAEPGGIKGELLYLSRMGRRVPAEVFVFHPWDIDWKNNSFMGYRLIKDGDGHDQWKKVSMPPPTVVYDQIYNRVAERRFLGDRNRLKKITKGRYFNSCYLNKFSVHKNLKLVGLGDHLPETRLLKKPEDLRTMLVQHQNVYIKPVTGSLGHGIIRVSRESGRFKLKTRGGSVFYALSIKDLYRKIREKIGKRIYIVQQGLDLLSYDGRVVDIRALVQKNGTGVWKITKMYVRVGPKGNITSNLASGGTAYPLQEIMASMFNNEQIEKIRSRIRELALTVCEATEKTSGEMFGEMGVDLGLDQSGKLWVIEVNSKPRRTTTGDGSKKLIQLSFIKPLRYAYHLATSEKSHKSVSG